MSGCPCASPDARLCAEADYWLAPYPEHPYRHGGSCSCACHAPVEAEPVLFLPRVEEAPEPAPVAPDLFGGETPEPVAAPVAPVEDDVIPEDPAQLALLDVPKKWEEHWRDMPEFAQRDMRPHSSINVQFRNDEDRRAFLKLMGQPPSRTRSIWYPPMRQKQHSQPARPGTKVQPNRYLVYIISKGRWKTPLTARALEQLGIDYHIVIEPQEWEHYAAVIDPARIYRLPFSNLGQGSIPARNWVWEHALSMGAARHWILDDNMDGFYRLNNNQKVKVVDENPFIACEDFTDRYTNVALSGLNYEFFADRRSVAPPFYLNTRVYSCILIDNALPHRWRGRYNEDTDLSIRVLKDGYCTVLFNAFLAKKLPTMKLAGGNTDELYQGDGRLKMAESLREQHPDVVKVTQKWGRYQHHVDYSRFQRNKLIPRQDAVTA